jgi:hypothetical protein
MSRPGTGPEIKELLTDLSKRDAVSQLQQMVDEGKEVILGRDGQSYSAKIRGTPLDGYGDTPHLAIDMLFVNWRMRQ